VFFAFLFEIGCGSLISLLFAGDIYNQIHTYIYKNEGSDRNQIDLLDVDRSSSGSTRIVIPGLLHLSYLPPEVAPY